MMKRLVYLVTGLAAVAAMVWLFPASRAAAQSVSNDTTAAQYQRALDEQAERSKRYDELLRGQEGIHKRSEALLLTQEEFLKRQLADLDKFEKILDGWERQQKQYQRYLDSLTK